MATDTSRDEEIEYQETIYAPVSYGPLTEGRTGRWFFLEDTAIVWTDDKDGAGIAWLRQTTENQRLWRHFQIAKSAGIPAGMAYQAALDSVQDAEEHEHEGDLSEARDAFNAMTGD